MKTIKATDLKTGDIFCLELKLHGREAFQVIKVKLKTVECISRSTGNPTTKQLKGNVILLK